ncbi:MAG TPA: hypothetical protein VLI90_14930 [Tepidisphaeraceae bacterium]|nr:hypothetical protein [Tepidisphaeraceae bacterium]
MSTPHYVAEKVKDQYLLVRQDVPVATAHPEMCIGGGILMLMGLFGRGPARLLCWLLGGTLLWTGLACRGKRCSGSGSRRKVRHMPRGPSYEGEDDGLRLRQKPLDETDEASMESFPASDPPAKMTPTRTV